MMQRLLLLRKSKAFWGVTLALGLAVSLAVWGVSQHPTKVHAAAALNSADVDIGRVSCLSIDPHQLVFDEKEYRDPKLVEENCRYPGDQKGAD